MFFKKTPTISTTELENKLSEKPQIIDVREPHEFKIGHIPGAKNIPLAKVSTYTPKGQVYVVCQSGMRSKRATKILLKQGHDVINVRGGMMAWAGAKKRRQELMRIVIIGGVAGGMSAATRLRRLDERAEVIVLEKGPYVSFANCGLPYYVAGEIDERTDLLVQTPESLQARFNLDVRPNS